MGENLRDLLHFAQGPLFRFALVLLVLGLIRLAWISASNAFAAFLVVRDRRAFWRQFRLRTLWHVFPSIVIHKVRGKNCRTMDTYHVLAACAYFVFRFGAIVIPAFMVAHVYLWERGLGVSWPSIPAGVSDVFSVVTVLAGVAVFLGRVYSPLIRSIDPAWAFIKPLILLVPFVTGMLAMHPTWSPVDYHVVMLIHVVSATVVFVMIPFGRMLSFLHRPIEAVLPELAWPRESPTEQDMPDAAPADGVSSSTANKRRPQHDLHETVSP